MQIQLTDFFDDYTAFTEFMAPKLYDIKTQRDTVANKISKAIRRMSKISDPLAVTFVVEWYKLTSPDYAGYLELRREYNRLKSIVMLAEVQFRGKAIEDFKPLAIAEAKEVSVKRILESITTHSNRDFYACPLHDEKTGSLKLYKNNSWYCFSCCQGGTSIDLIMKYYQLDILDAVNWLLGFGG